MTKKPLNNQELHDIIVERIVRNGYTCDLNDIDVSGVTDCSQLFKGIRFHGDISKWNVAHVTNMNEMFARSEFNGDITSWNVSSVTDMAYMFDGGMFDQDISGWNVKNVKTMQGMFLHSPFNQSLAAWDVCGVEDFSKMFYESPYEKDLNAWNPRSAKTMQAMLFDSAYKGQLSNWRLSPSCNTDYLLNPAKFPGMEPSIVQFRLIYAEHLHYEEKMWRFVQQNRPVLESMGLDSMQAAVWLHAQWYDGPKAFESLNAPLGAFTDSISR